MTSRIVEGSPDTGRDLSLPDVHVTPTPATPYCPAGRIVDDSSRGTLYWEIVDEEDDEPESGGNQLNRDVVNLRDGSPSRGKRDSADGPGKPFGVTWIATHPVPFIRTRGLQNSYNANKEVKVARDGTEVEPLVGSRLLGLFKTDQCL